MFECKPSSDNGQCECVLCRNPRIPYILMVGAVLGFAILLAATLTASGQDMRPDREKAAEWKAFTWWNAQFPVENGYGDLARVAMPVWGQSPCLSFVVEPTTNDLSGKWLSIQFTVTGDSWLTNLDESEFVAWNNPDDAAPVVGIFFSTQPNGYDLDRCNLKPSEYWFCNALGWGQFGLNVGQTVTFTVPISDPALWINGHGEPADDVLPLFEAATANVGQIGFYFGAHFYDTGVASNPANSEGVVFHVQNFQTYQP